MIVQGFAIGLLIQGAIKWGLGAPVETKLSFVQGNVFSFGNELVEWNNFNSSEFARTGMISWGYPYNNTLIGDLDTTVVSSSFDFRVRNYVLFQNDYLVYEGPKSAFNISSVMNSSLPYYFRVAPVMEVADGQQILQDFSDVLRIIPERAEVAYFEN